MSELIKGTASPKQQNTCPNLVKCTRALHKHRPETMNPGRPRLKPTGNRGNPDKILHNFDHAAKSLNPIGSKKAHTRPESGMPKVTKGTLSPKQQGTCCDLIMRIRALPHRRHKVAQGLIPQGNCCRLFQTPLKTLATSMAIGRA